MLQAINHLRDIKIKILDEDTRVLTFIPRGRVYEEICEAIL